MKKLLLVLLFPLVGCAQPLYVVPYPVPVQVYATGVVVNSVPVYSNQGVSTPVTTCVDKQVPVYGSQYNGGATLLGSVIGGAIGYMIAPGSTQVAVTSLGVITGGVVGYGVSNQTNVVGYRVVKECRVDYVYSTVQAISYYAVTVNTNGQLVTFKSNMGYAIGQQAVINANNTLQ